MKRRPNWDTLDLKNGQDCRNGFPAGYDTVILLAAHLGHRIEDYQHNLEIYNSLVRSYADRDRPFIIYTSSAAVYRDEVYPHLEVEELEPVTLYGRSKLLGERIIEDVFDHTILRLSNVFGDGDGNGVVDIFKRGGKSIYGHGGQIRDYVYVDTVVGAITKIADNTRYYKNEIYNISSGKGMTVLEAFEKYGTGKPDMLEPRNFDVECSILSNGLAKQDELV